VIVNVDGQLGHVDRHLLGEGRHHRLWEVLGGHLIDNEGAQFAVWAPNARSVRVVGDWNHWSEDPRHAVALEPVGDLGIWAGLDVRAREGQAYKYMIEERSGRTTLRADPMAAAAEVPPATASVLWRSSHQWRQSTAGSDWRAARAQRNSGRTSVYEVHLGSWRRHPDGRSHSYRELAESLPAWVVELGCTHVEFMPIATHPFAGSWGYQVTGYYAPDARLGTPDDLRLLIEAFHESGVGVLVDCTSPGTRGHWRSSTALRSMNTTILVGVNTQIGGRSCSTTVDWRCGTSWWPTPSTGSRSSASTDSASTQWPR